MINCTGWKRHQQGFRKHVKEADDAADYVVGVTPLTQAAFQKTKEKP
jgi:hypothetical protein